jgi:transcriptional regulator with XRE-family HTH domain
MKVANETTPEPIDGMALKLLRTSAGVHAVQVARAAGVSHQYVAKLEKATRPTGPAVAKYLQALAEARR